MKRVSGKLRLQLVVKLVNVEMTTPLKMTKRASKRRSEEDDAGDAGQGRVSPNVRRKIKTALAEMYRGMTGMIALRVLEMR